jgi:hypothetical protein
VRAPHLKIDFHFRRRHEMKRIATALLCALLLATVGALAGPSPGGYPDMCTDVSNLETAENAGYVTCAEKKAGSSTTYPGYLRLQDGNGTLLVDVFAWTNGTATTTFVRGLATVGVVGFVAGNTWTRAVAGAGAVNAGTQRVTLASDDPAVAHLESAVTALGNIQTAVQVLAYTDDADQDNCDSTATSSTQKTLAAGRYKIKVTGASASIKVGGAVALAAGGDKGETIPEGDSTMINCPVGCDVYHISSSAAGEICFIPQN